MESINRRLTQFKDQPEVLGTNWLGQCQWPGLQISSSYHAAVLQLPSKLSQRYGEGLTETAGYKCLGYLHLEYPQSAESTQAFKLRRDTACSFESIRTELLNKPTHSSPLVPHGPSHSPWTLCWEGQQWVVIEVTEVLCVFICSSVISSPNITACFWPPRSNVTNWWASAPPPRLYLYFGKVRNR